MKFISTIVAAATLFSSPAFALTTIPQHHQNCSTFGNHVAHYMKSQKTAIFNSTLIPAHSMNNTFEFCRVLGQVAYTNNNTLNFEVWLPDKASWTGRFMAVGNGGMAGVIDTVTMLGELNAGFAVAAGDSGHLAALNNNGGGAPGVYLPYLHDLHQVKTWIHNAISTFTGPAKSIISRYYGTHAKYSYYNGCSTGGAQGFALAQFHPELFDGIYSGSPGNWYSHLALSFLWNGLKTQGASYIPQSTLDTITAAVLAACDTLDGVKDGLIENPLKCKFDINTLACGSATPTAACLTASQLAAVKAIYAGPTSSIDGSEIYPGFSFGSENSWAFQEQYLSNAFSIPILQNLAFKNLTYNYTMFNFGSDVKVVDENVGQYIDEIDPDLRVFKALGGKMITTQGWADAFNAATWPIEHMGDMQKAVGGDISDWYNLFMVPGGGHCTGGYSSVPGVYHINDPLIQWVEKGIKPASILSTTPSDGSNRTRLLCPWPKTANYQSGDFNSSTSYICK